MCSEDKNVQYLIRILNGRVGIKQESRREWLEKSSIKPHDFPVVSNESRLLVKLGRNEPCHCRSRLKFKKCCLK
ncbi:SEC-C metal-binding domain-containing protein [Psychromonas ingrahamii]|uniref:SEC-C metal-binding domain-containing protein n=1 Tax=Psychromonas ingrahamii TaxID=357794 RepID=UPI0012EE9948